LNALYDIQANGLCYEGDQASTQEANQTPAAAVRTSTVTSGANNFGANF
jgi:hypothetical protein